MFYFRPICGKIPILTNISNGLKSPTRYGESDNMDTGIIVLRFVFHRSHSYVFLLFVFVSHIVVRSVV